MSILRVAKLQGITQTNFEITVPSTHKLIVSGILRANSIQNTSGLNIWTPDSSGNITIAGNVTTSGNIQATAITATGRVNLPTWTTATRPNSNLVNGIIGYNTDEGVEVYTISQGWVVLGAGLIQYTIRLWGAGGGGGTSGGWSAGSEGGGGGYAYGEIKGIPSGSNLILQVGQGGVVNGTQFGFGGGGIANRTGSDNRYGSNGGGYTGVFLNSVSQANCILLAGGGGGGGSSRAGTGNYGGAGGGSNGQDGNSPYDGKSGFRGTGGTQNAAGNCPSQANSYTARALEGGTCGVNGYGGAGGGGYFGGGAGGYSESNTMGGGGGGSGFINTTYVRNEQNLQGNFKVPAGTSATGYPGGNISYGGDVAGTGRNGYASITRNGVTTNYSYIGSNVTIVVP
jgi:hypothetical protein